MKSDSVVIWAVSLALALAIGFGLLTGLSSAVAGQPWAPAFKAATLTLLCAGASHLLLRSAALHRAYGVAPARVLALCCASLGVLMSWGTVAAALAPSAAPYGVWTALLCLLAVSAGWPCFQNLRRSLGHSV